MTMIKVPKALIRDPARFGGAPNGDCLTGHPVWQNDRLVALGPGNATDAHIVLPHLVETHCHLDKCHSIHRLGTVGGDLMEAITRQREDKQNWTEDDLLSRATRGHAEAQAAGCKHIRSHIDWGEHANPPLSWEVLTRATLPGVQCAALTGVAQMADPDFATTVATHVAAANGVLGAFILYHDAKDREAGLRNMFAAADKYGLMLDFHVDEGLGTYDGVEAVADMALDTGFQGPILCGHAVALMDKGTDDMTRITDKLARAGVTICALPTTNLYLQGREQNSTPDRRGLTRLRELHAAGVRITVGSDNVGDAFCPTGQHDPMAALNLALLAAHLDPPLDRWLPLITTHAAEAIGKDATCIDGAHRDDLIFTNTRTTADLIAGRIPLCPTGETT
jgi:cytosine deaminase